MANYNDVRRDLYIGNVSVDVITHCGGQAWDGNRTYIKLRGFEQPVTAKNVSDANGHGLDIEIVGDWESHDFMLAMKEVRRLFKHETRINHMIYRSEHGETP